MQVFNNDLIFLINEYLDIEIDRLERWIKMLNENDIKMKYIVIDEMKKVYELWKKR